MNDTNRLLRRDEVEAQTGLSRSAIYRLMRAGQFPEPDQDRAACRPLASVRTR